MTMTAVIKSKKKIGCRQCGLAARNSCGARVSGVDAAAGVSSGGEIKKMAQLDFVTFVRRCALLLMINRAALVAAWG